METRKTATTAVILPSNTLPTAGMTPHANGAGFSSAVKIALKRAAFLIYLDAFMY